MIKSDVFFTYNVLMKLYELPKKQQTNFFMYGPKEMKKICLTPGY